MRQSIRIRNRATTAIWRETTNRNESLNCPKNLGSLLRCVHNTGRNISCTSRPNHRGAGRIFTRTGLATASLNLCQESETNRPMQNRIMNPANASWRARYVIVKSKVRVARSGKLRMGVARVSLNYLPSAHKCRANSIAKRGWRRSPNSLPQ